MSGFKALTATLRSYVDATREAQDASDNLDLNAGISDTLRKLLGAGDAKGDPYHATFDDQTGKMLGAAFADKYAFQLVEAIAELVRRKGEKGQDPTLYEMNLQQAKKYFTYIFGNKFGDIGRLIEEFNALLKKQEAAQRGATTSVALARKPTPTTTTASLKILQQAGMFR